MMGMRKRLSRFAVTASLAALIGVGGLPGVALADSTTVCVPYSETTGSCIQQFFDDNGNLTATHFFLYWGNWYIEF